MPYLLIQRIENVAKKERAPLPYTFIISKIIRAYHMHPLDEEEKLEAQEIRLNTMSYLEYMKYANEWVLKPRRRKGGKDESDEEMVDQAYNNIYPKSPP